MSDIDRREFCLGLGALSATHKGLAHSLMKGHGPVKAPPGARINPPNEISPSDPANRFPVSILSGHRTAVSIWKDGTIPATAGYSYCANFACHRDRGGKL